MKNKLLTLTLALFLPLVSAGQQSLSAFLLTSGPNTDPATAGTHIVAIGKSTTGAPDMLIDLPAYSAATSGSTLVPMPEVTLDEVLTTADLVVLVGRESANAHHSVYYRVTEQSDVTGSPLFQQHHCHPGLNATLSSITYAAPLEAGEFAVAYRQGTDTLVAMHLTIDTLGGVLLVDAQKTAIAENAPIAGMAYHANNHLLTVLLPEAVNTFLILQPYVATPYVTPEILCARIPSCPSLDDVGDIGYVAAGGNGLTVQRVGPTVGGIVTCERQAGRLVQRTKVPPAVRFKSTIDLLVFNTFYGFLPSVTLLNNLHVFCNL